MVCFRPHSNQFIIFITCITWHWDSGPLRYTWAEGITISPWITTAPTSTWTTRKSKKPKWSRNEDKSIRLCMESSRNGSLAISLKNKPGSPMIALPRSTEFARKHFSEIGSKGEQEKPCVSARLSTSIHQNRQQLQKKQSILTILFSVFQAQRKHTVFKEQTISLKDRTRARPNSVDKA